MTPGRLHFDTDALPERDRFPAFCEEMIRRYAALDMFVRDEIPFRGSIELQRVGVVDIGFIATTPTDYVRTPNLVRDGDDALCVVLCRNGSAYQTQRGDGQALGAGEGIVCDSGHIGGIHVTADSRFWSLKIPRTRIIGQVPGLARPAGAKLDKDPLARQLLFAYLGGTLDIDLTNGGRAAQLYDQHIVDLVVLALGAAGEARLQAEQSGARAVRRAAILHEIDRHLGDPALSAAVIGARLGITARYVHLLLEETGQSFTEHVLRKRLEQTAAMLRDTRYRDRKIGAIALEAGFVNFSHFSRAFRRRFGDTPSRMRRTTLRGDS